MVRATFPRSTLASNQILPPALAVLVQKPMTYCTACFRRSGSPLTISGAGVMLSSMVGLDSSPVPCQSRLARLPSGRQEPFPERSLVGLDPMQVKHLPDEPIHPLR